MPKPFTSENVHKAVFGSIVLTIKIISAPLNLICHKEDQPKDDKDDSVS